jgi:hypothetical protein
MSPTAPTVDVVISQAAADAHAPFRWNQPAGNDRNPRDTGQSFLSSGFVLDKITVKVATLATGAYDSQSMTVAVFTLTDGGDFVPDSTVASESGLLPADMKPSFDSGDTYLTIDITDVTLNAGQQYGFLLMHDAQQSTGDNMLLSAQIGSAYTDGIGITRQQRGSGGDNYQQTTSWDGSSSRPADLEFYLQGLTAPPLVLGQVVVSEFMASNEDALDDGDGSSSDWIEIWYSTDLDNWFEDTGASQTPSAPDANDVETVAVTLTPALLAGPKLFVRVQAAEN